MASVPPLVSGAAQAPKSGDFWISVPVDIRVPRCLVYTIQQQGHQPVLHVNIPTVLLERQIDGMPGHVIALRLHKITMIISVGGKRWLKFNVVEHHCRDRRRWSHGYPAWRRKTWSSRELKSLSENLFYLTGTMNKFKRLMLAVILLLSPFKYWEVCDKDNNMKILSCNNENLLLHHKKY